MCLTDYAQTNASIAVLVNVVLSRDRIKYEKRQMSTHPGSDRTSGKYVTGGITSWHL